VFPVTEKKRGVSHTVNFESRFNGCIYATIYFRGGPKKTHTRESESIGTLSLLDHDELNF